jgi:hypothetical protein
MSDQELLPKQMTVAAYDPFRAQLAELKDANNKAVFDYRDPKGNKEARSHIYKLRQTKAAVDKVRKAEKEESLNYGRLIDAQAKEIIGEIESMIAVHETPILQIEKEEENRVKAHRDAIAKIESFLNAPSLGDTTGQIKINRDAFVALEPDEKFEEFTAEAMRTYKSVLERFDFEFDKTLKREREQAELEALRKAQAEREQKEREEKLLREAAAKAEADKLAAIQAEKDKAERERLAAERARLEDELKHKAELERLEREKIAEQERQKAEAARLKQEKLEAEQRAENAAKAERDKIQREQEARDAEIAQREADTKHRGAINREAASCLVQCGLSEDQAKNVVTAIVKGLISNVKIVY